ncbi:MAG: hypothetical protein FWD33_03445 [Alphaproteobacteria bacterium]|nr:hypothetical protein [Alphaproteobacteria bacterium]
MKSIKIGEWDIEYDKQATEKIYAAIKPYACDCISCQNYRKATENIPSEIRNLFDAFGIDFYKAAEIYDCSAKQDDKLIYGGWYHFIGRIVGEKDGKENGMLIGWYEITKDFKITFTKDSALIDENFPKDNICQMEIVFNLPWVFEDKQYFNEL